MKWYKKIFVWLFSAALVSFCNADTIVRQWELTGIRTETFSAESLMEITVHFPSLIPQTHLPGYSDFTVRTGDSPSPSIDGFLGAAWVAFDAGFLYFDHVLTVKLHYRSGIFPDSVDMRQMVLFRDPYSVTGLHQWYRIDNLTFDTIAEAISFTYNHSRYYPLTRRGRNAGTVSTQIASTGYPFVFGFFYSDSTRMRKSSPEPVLSRGLKGTICQKLLFWGGGAQELEYSKPLVYSVNGRIITNRSRSGRASGVYLTGLKNEN